MPVKGFKSAKSRLSPLLSEKQRGKLAAYLSEKTFALLKKLADLGKIEGFVVTSNDPGLRKLAGKYGGHFLLDDLSTEGESSLNQALSKAARWSGEKLEEGSLLILPADLLFLEVEDLTSLLDNLKSSPFGPLAVIAPDHLEKGTNALLLRPPDLLNYFYQFGPESFTSHTRLLGSMPDLKILVVQRPGFAFDLDQPEDFEALPGHIREEILEASSCRK